MNAPQIWILISLIILAIIAILAVYRMKNKKQKRLSTLASIAFVLILFSIFTQDRLTSYSLIAAGVILAIIDVIINKRKK